MSFIGNELRQRREALGISQAEAARRWGCTRQEWGRWENGGRQPRQARLDALLAFLDGLAVEKQGRKRKKVQ